MKALAKLEPGPGHVELVERPEPRPGPGEVLVDVLAAGVCGTDLHIEADEYPHDPPVTLGHEVSGVVAAVGAAVDLDWRGQRVVTETFYDTCGRCDWCRDGRPNLCPRRRSIGSHVDGGFADQLVVPAVNLHAVRDGIDGYAATLYEPLACVCNCLLDPPAVQPGDTVVVTGPGPVGLLAAQVARAMGGDVVVCGLPTDAARLEVATALGFAATDEPPAATAHVVVECSGTQGGARLCLEVARRGGRYVQVGLFGGQVAVPLDEVCYRELIVTSGLASTPRSWRHAGELVATGTVELAPLITRATPLSAWQDVFADLRKADALKIVFDPRM